jgi:glycosyltransferase involved in cell wall biosynthesis
VTPIRIVHVISGLMTGGAETQLFRLAAAADRGLWRFSVVSAAGRGTFGDRLEALGVPVCALGLDRRDPRAPFRLWRAVHEFDPQMVQGWMGHGNLLASLAGLFRPGLPVLWNVRATVYDLSLEKPGTARVIRLGARLSGSPSRIVYNSELSARQHEALGFRPNRRVVIPNGFDVEHFRPDAESRRATRQRLSLQDGECAVALVARYHPMKDHRTFLMAIAELARRGLRVRAVLAGLGADEMNVELNGLIQELGLASSTILLGEVADTVPIMRAADVVCLSSSWGEGFPNVLGEAMACETPCITTDIGDARSVVGDCGSVVPPRSSEQLAAAIEAIAIAPTEERRALGARARIRIQNNFSIEHVVDRYSALYREVLGAQRQRIDISHEPSPVSRAS